MTKTNFRVLGKVLLLIGSVALIAVSVYGIIGGGSLIRLYHNAIRYEAIRIPVDLSATGKYTGTFRQKYIATHGKQFRIEVNPPFTSDREMCEAVKGLSGELYIKGQSPDVKEIWPLVLGGAENDDSPGCRWSDDMEPFTPYLFVEAFDTKYEPCDFGLRVFESATAFKGRKQQLVVKNVLCRTESLSMYMGAAFIIAGILGIAIAVIMIYVIIRKSWKSSHRKMVMEVERSAANTPGPSSTESHSFNPNVEEGNKGGNKT